MERDRHVSAAASDDDLELTCDAVVVGLGAGGGMAFRELARRGLDVVGLEMGEWVSTESIVPYEEEMLPRLFQESGARSTEDMAVNVLQGKGVGGSTVHNTNLCKRLPETIRQRWAFDYGLDWATSASLEDDYEYVESLLDVSRIPDHRVNENNRVLADGLDALDWEGGRLAHNRDHDDCRESGFCELGCPNAGKQNAEKLLVPEGMRAGGRVVTRARVDEVAVDGARARGVRGTAAGEAEGNVRVDADDVVLAASATGTPDILQRSDLPDDNRLAGSNLHLHPGATVVGHFGGTPRAPIESWLGNPQSVDCTELLGFEHGSDRRAWIVPGAAHPAGAAMFMPGFGPSHGDWMRRYPDVASLIVMLHDHQSGRVHRAEGERIHLHYGLDRKEYEALAVGLRGAAELLLAAGANEAVIPTSPPLHATSSSDLSELTSDQLGPLNPPLAAVHPMSTAWMGRNPDAAVVDPRGEHHEVDGLWVADGSLFPTSIGVPPQLTIYTMGRRIARTVAR